MNTYPAFYKNKSIQVTEESSYKAQLKAAKLFNAKKSYEVTIVLISIEDKQVTHSTSSI